MAFTTHLLRTIVRRFGVKSDDDGAVLEFINNQLPYLSPNVKELIEAELLGGGAASPSGLGPKTLNSGRVTHALDSTSFRQVLGGELRRVLDSKRGADPIAVYVVRGIFPDVASGSRINGAPLHLLVATAAGLALREYDTVGILSSTEVGIVVPLVNRREFRTRAQRPVAVAVESDVSSVAYQAWSIGDRLLEVMRARSRKDSSDSLAVPVDVSIGFDVVLSGDQRAAAEVLSAATLAAGRVESEEEPVLFARGSIPSAG